MLFRSYSVILDESIPPCSIQIKTLIWRVNDEDGSFQHIFATATRMTDYVDEKRLMGIISSKYSFNVEIKNKLKLSLAEKEVAEQITGLKSGSISPIFYATQEKIDIFFDRNILDDTQSLTQFVSVGSGMPGHSLHLSWETLLRAAQIGRAHV